MNRRIVMIIAMTVVFIIGQASAQSIIKGKVKNAITGAEIVSANISVSETAQGISSGLSGDFSFMVSPGTYTLSISSIGYVPDFRSLTVVEDAIADLGEIFLQPDVIALEEVNIISSVASDRSTPIALSSISTRKIETQLAEQTFPEVMKMVPGVYASRTGGGSGDAAVNIRGFEQENVALLLNGIPISSVENGLVYWNNWIGLADATRAIQVQRGLGASNVALNSVGGTINIVTKTTEVEKGGSIAYSLSSYGNSKLSLALSSGKMNNGVAVNFLGSRTSGSGYVDATYVDAWAYFVSISKEFNQKHTLVFTALGAPERHGQRNLKLSQDEIDQHGLKFNKDWGSYNGQINNASENFYNKPHLTLNHYWKMTDKVFLATSVYYSPGKGGGKWSEAYGWGTPTIFEYRNPSGQIDWDEIYQNNATNTDTATLSNGERLTGFSHNVQTDFLASHHWGGLLSRLEYQKNENFKYTLGIHLRYFKSKLQEKITDLLGGEFFIDDYGWAVDGPAGRNEIKTVGEVIKVDNGAINPSASIFGQIDYEKGNTNAFLSGTFNNVWYQRYDNYNYVSDTKSEILLKTGFDVKAGLNQKFGEHHHAFVNGGFFSRAPYFKYVFGNFTNIPTKNVANEKVKAFEFGYGYTRSGTRFRINYYYTYWQDKSFLSNEYEQLEDDTKNRALVTGLDALHTGFELEVEQQVTESFKLGGLLSLGNWKWKNDVSATLFNVNNVAVDTVNVYADGLYVGGAPQFQAGLFGDVNILKTVTLSANWVYYDNIYASFDPTTRNNPDDNSQSFRIPGYSLIDLHLYYPFEFIHQPAVLSMNCFNLLNSEHIIRGEDGVDHDLDSFRGFWGFGRTFSVMLKLNF